MGTITRSFVNGLTTNGVLGASNINNASLNNITSISGSEMALISSATASSSASIEFSLGNYKEYQFYFVDIHPATAATFQFQSSTDSGSSYGVTLTSTAFNAYQGEDGSNPTLGYNAGGDLAQSTSFQRLMRITSDNDNCGAGYLRLFNPASTTYVKHFISNCNELNENYTQNEFQAGYFNTTSALTNIKFQFSSGNIDAGSIYMYGIGA